jgi:SAM-dependent methyltransferase
MSHRFFHWWVNALPHRWYLRRQVPRFLRACPDPFRGEVLELGSGRGNTSQKILETFPQVELTAVDVDARAAEQFIRLEAKYGRRLKVKQANMFALPFDRDAFDMVIAINVFPHIQRFSLRKAILESLRVLRPGGLVGVSDHILVRPHLAATRATVEEILEAEDCKVLHATGGHHYDLWARKAYPVEPPAEA